VFTVPGSIAHYALSADNFDKEFVDFFLISKAQTIYHCKKEKMYMSGFAQTAAMAGGKCCEVLYY